ncbi:MAG: hypothetical protein QXZ09_09755 [Candidatus Methanomethylicaceae archaeon]
MENLKNETLTPTRCLEFRTRKMTIRIDYERCEPAVKEVSNPECGFACVKGCRLYGRNILKIEKNRPQLSVKDPKEIVRLDNECLACEYQCQQHGTGCIQIEVDMAPLIDYRTKVGLK